MVPGDRLEVVDSRVCSSLVEFRNEDRHFSYNPHLYSFLERPRFILLLLVYVLPPVEGLGLKVIVLPLIPLGRGVQGSPSLPWLLCLPGFRNIPGHL